MDAEIELTKYVLKPNPLVLYNSYDENAGVKVLQFRLTSASRSDMVVTFNEPTLWTLVEW